LAASIVAASIGQPALALPKSLKPQKKTLETARTYKKKMDGDGDGDGGDGDGDADGDDDGSQHWQPALAASIGSQHWPASIGITKIIETVEKNTRNRKDLQKAYGW